MKNLALSSLLFLLLSGCSLSLFNGFRTDNEAPAGNTDIYSWFLEDTGRFLFQSSIDVFKNHFSGLLFVKPIDGKSHRILFITEVGMKIFDMEFFSNGDFKLHYCIGELNRKSLIKTLRNDLSLMLENVAGNGSIKIMKEKRTGRMIIKSKDYNGTRFCYINKKSNKVEELIRTGSLTNKVNIKFDSALGIFPDSILISHYNLKLKIQLTRLDEN